MTASLPNFARVTSQPEHAAIRGAAKWGTDVWLATVLDLIDQELQANSRDPDQQSPRFGELLNDLIAASKTHAGVALMDIEYVRLHLSAQLATMSVAAGRWSRGYEWLLTGITDLPWRKIEGGTPTTFVLFPERLTDFLCDSRLVQIGNSQRFVLIWLTQLFYYSWKQGGLREIVQELLPNVIALLDQSLRVLRGDPHKVAAEAACHLSTWLVRNGDQDNAKLIVRALETAFSRLTTSTTARKTIAIHLSCRLGEFSSFSTAEWARRALQFTSDLEGHERLQLLINASAATDANASFEEILTETRSYAAETADATPDLAAFNYAQARLFDLLAPFVGRLIRDGNTAAAVRLMAAWYCVPENIVRTSPVLAYALTSSKDAVYATPGRVLTYPRVSGEFLRAITDMSNQALRTSDTIADDPAIVIESHAYPGVPNPALAGPFEDELVRFHELNRLAGDQLASPLDATALLPTHSFAHPIQALMLRHLGTTWPLLSSLQEPAQDRPLKRVLFWTAGTFGGAVEAEAVSGLLKEAGITVDMHVGDTDLDGFIRLYESKDYDALWINAHGEFAAEDPHFAHLLLSADRQHRVTVAELCGRTVPPNGRRLLFLNICDGGNVMGTNAPPKLGIAPLLASRYQCVISHLWPALMFVAATFGSLLAAELAEGRSFFSAFARALSAIRQDRDGVLARLNSLQPPPSALIERITHRSDEFSELSIFNWGSPIFYE